MGHLVASMYGGPPELYNMVPQDRSMNRNYNSVWILNDWRSTEFRIRDWLRKDRGYVHLEVVLGYNDDLSRGRPQNFIYRAVFYSHSDEEQDTWEGDQRNGPPRQGI